MSSIVALLIMDKIDDVKTMAFGGALSIPYALSLIVPALRHGNKESDSWIYKEGFVFSTVLVASFFNGFG